MQQFISMNHEIEKSWCYFHPKEAVIGVCPLCLNERLLILAAKQAHGHGHAHRKKKTPIFAFPSFLRPSNYYTTHHHDHHHDHHHHDYHDHDTSTSDQEDSFISIKFEDNGIASWEKNTIAKVSVEDCKQLNYNKDRKSVIEHGKSHSSLRWRKPIRQMFQLIRWKSRSKSNKGNVCHVGTKVARKGWIRSLTKKRAKE